MCKIFMRKTTKCWWNNWKNNKINGVTPCVWTWRLDIVTISLLLNLIYRFYTIPVKVPAGYFVDNDKLITKFIQRCKRLRIANTHWRSRTALKVGGLTLLNIMTYYWSKVIVIVYFRQARQREQWNRDPRNRPT